MTLPRRIKDIDTIDEAFRGEYALDDATGMYVLDLDDPDAATKIDEFRTNNRNLNREVETMKETITKFDAFKGITEDDITQMREMKDRQATALSNDLLKDIVDVHGAVDHVKLTSYADRQFDGERKELHRALESVKAERDAFGVKFEDERGKYQKQVRRTAVRTAVDVVARTRPGAMDDILARADSAVGFDDKQNLVVLDAGGDPRYGKKGGDYMTLEEWAGELVDTAPHLFEARKGGGAQGDQQVNRAGVPIVDAMDPEALGRNFKAIIKGEAQARYEVR